MSDVTVNTISVDSDACDLIQKCKPGLNSGNITRIAHQLLFELGDHATFREQKLAMQIAVLRAESKMFAELVVAA